MNDERTPSADPYDPERHLIMGLAAGHERLYHTSAAFKVSIDTLAQMLPHMVRGLAEHAEKMETKYQAELARRMHEPAPINIEEIMRHGQQGKPGSPV